MILKIYISNQMILKINHFSRLKWQHMRNIEVGPVIEVRL